MKLPEVQLNLVLDLIAQSPEPKRYPDRFKRTLEVLRRLNLVTYVRCLETGCLIARLSRSAESTSRRLSEDDPPARRTHEEIASRVKELIERRTDWGLKELANTVGATTTRVKAILTAHGVVIQNRKPGPQHLRRR